MSGKCLIVCALHYSKRDTYGDDKYAEEKCDCGGNANVEPETSPIGALQVASGPPDEGFLPVVPRGREDWKVD
jgi:hypothetical protein